VCATEGKDASTGPSRWLTANEIFPPSEHVAQYKSVCTFPCGKYQLKHVPFEEAVKDLSEVTTEEFIAEAEVLHSDLLPGKYEGSYSENFY
jgi:hypothetical protein